jgi:uncharacterized protein with NRDE domain
MCLILFAFRAHPDYPLVVAANRDEFYARPTAPATWWDDAPQVLAGRDLRGGGTWMGITRSGRWAALTNYRDPADLEASGRSRGHLVAGYLRGEQPPGDYLETLRPRASAYSGFNLLVGDPRSLHWYANRQARGPRALAPGIYGVSNHLLDTPWPKVARGKRALAELLAPRGRPDPERLLSILLDRTFAADHELPDTGVGAEWERVLSAPFIVSPEYGTRASTALLVDRHGRALFHERSFEPGTGRRSEARFEFEMRGEETTREEGRGKSSGRGSLPMAPHPPTDDR